MPTAVLQKKLPWSSTESRGQRLCHVSNKLERKFPGYYTIHEWKDNETVNEQAQKDRHKIHAQFF